MYVFLLAISLCQCLLQVDLIGITDPQYPEYNMNDIKTEYHPAHQKEPLIQSFEEYIASDAKMREPVQSTEDPWQPYKTRLDFELSEFALSAYLNKDHIERLIKMINIAASGLDNLTLTNHSDLLEVRKIASQQLTPVCH